MLRKILTICALIFCAFSGIYAIKQEIPFSFNSFKDSQNHPDDLLACKKCKKHKKHAVVFNKDSDKIYLLACKDCP